MKNYKDSAVESGNIVSNYFPSQSSVVFELLLDLEPAATHLCAQLG